MVPSAAGGLAGGALLARRRPRGPFVRNPCDNSRSGAILTPEGASRTEWDPGRTIGPSRSGREPGMYTKEEREGILWEFHQSGM